MYYKSQIEQWLAEGEGPMLDFKQKITSAPKIARSIVAFANSRGGKIVVGVEDNGRIIGVDIGSEEYELKRAAEKYCQPAIELDFEAYETHGRMLLIAHVLESNQKPHYAIDKKGKSKIYVRIADECVVPAPIVVAVLEKGDLNYLQRNHQYFQLKQWLIGFLKKNRQITVSEFMRLQHCSERSAKRTLLDLLFEGVLTTTNYQIFQLSRKNGRGRGYEL